MAFLDEFSDKNTGDVVPFAIQELLPPAARVLTVPDLCVSRLLLRAPLDFRGRSWNTLIPVRTYTVLLALSTPGAAPGQLYVAWARQPPPRFCANPPLPEDEDLLRRIVSVHLARECAVGGPSTARTNSPTGRV